MFNPPIQVNTGCCSSLFHIPKQAGEASSMEPGYFPMTSMHFSGGCSGHKGYNVKSTPTSYTRPLLCKICNMAWESFEEHRQHMRHAHKYVSCQKCHTLCPSSGALRSHMNREHTPKLVCPLCNKTFHCKLNYTGHMNMHSGIRPYACDRCGKMFAYQQSKYAHEKICALDRQDS